MRLREGGGLRHFVVCEHHKHGNMQYDKIYPTHPPVETQGRVMVWALIFCQEPQCKMVCCVNLRGRSGRGQEVSEAKLMQLTCRDRILTGVLLRGRTR